VTPFRLRDRIRRAIGGDKTADERVEVTFLLPDGSRAVGRGETRYTLVMASQTLPTPIAIGCPDGGCGGCGVEVVDGASALAPPSDAEIRSFEQRQNRKPRPEERLACHARVVKSGATVKVARVWTLDEQKGG
jgi:ferredoxin